MLKTEFIKRLRSGSKGTPTGELLESLGARDLEVTRKAAGGYPLHEYSFVGANDPGSLAYGLKQNGFTEEIYWGADFQWALGSPNRQEIISYTEGDIYLIEVGDQYNSEVKSQREWAKDNV